MEKEDTTLFENPWLSLCMVTSPVPYVYSHETRCNGRILAVLPFRDGPDREYLVRSEVTPCWGPDPELSSVTGGWQGGDIEDDVVREVLEETGYTITREDLIPLGESRASKSSDTLYSLFAVNLTGRVAGIATGDGTPLEAGSSVQWVSADTLAWLKDPQLAVMYRRLQIFRDE
jgi:8-oxo-dGTP pyrophosphatase MutT (NUDIX family)